MLPKFNCTFAIKLYEEDLFVSICDTLVLVYLKVHKDSKNDQLCLSGVRK